MLPLDHRTAPSNVIKKNLHKIHKLYVILCLFITSLSVSAVRFIKCILRNKKKELKMMKKFVHFLFFEKINDGLLNNDNNRMKKV